MGLKIQNISWAKVYGSTMRAGFKTTMIIVGTQLGVTLACTAVAAMLGGIDAARSAAIGGGISVLTSVFFALRVFLPGRGQAIKQLAKRFYVAEAQKLLLTAVLFYVAIRWLEVSFLPMMAAFAVTLLVYWLVLPFTISDGVPVERRQ